MLQKRGGVTVVVGDLTKIVLDRINNYIEKERITRRQFAKKVGISYNSLNNMLSRMGKGESFLTMTTLKKIEKVTKK